MEDECAQDSVYLFKIFGTKEYLWFFYAKTDKILNYHGTKMLLNILETQMKLYGSFQVKICD